MCPVRLLAAAHLVETGRRFPIPRAPATRSSRPWKKEIYEGGEQWVGSEAAYQEEVAAEGGADPPVVPG
jgi:hypothetical protein